MGDVAEILGLATARPNNSIVEETAKILNEKPKGLNAGPKLSKKPKGMSREVFSLVGADGFLPSMTAGTPTASGSISSGFKMKRKSSTKGKWLWTTFDNSARGDSEKFLNHWVKADIQYADYPYAKFNVSMDPVVFSDDEYASLLSSSTWTKEETIHLLDLVSRYGLRWPVILDRYEKQPYRTSEDMQARYYGIILKLRDHRLGSNFLDFSKDDHKATFNYEQEKRRKYQLELSYRKTKEEEMEEHQLREELKNIEALLKKSKPKSKSSSSAAAAVASTSMTESTYHIPVSLPPEAILSAALVHERESIPPGISIHPPIPGRPALQSSRLIITEPALGLPKILVKKMNTLLQDLGAPEFPLPTKTVCDLYDQVRKEAAILLNLQQAILKKEKELGVYRAVQDSVAGAEGLGRDISVPYSAMLSKLPDPSTDRMNMVATMPSSPTKQSLSADSDLINTLGIALLAAESTASFDSEALQSSSSQPKKAVKRKAPTEKASDGSSGAGGTGAAEGDKKPPPKRSRKKPAPPIPPPPPLNPSASTQSLKSMTVVQEESEVSKN